MRREHTEASSHSGGRTARLLHTGGELECRAGLLQVARLSVDVRDEHGPAVAPKRVTQNGCELGGAVGHVPPARDERDHHLLEEGERLVDRPRFPRHPLLLLRIRRKRLTRPTLLQPLRPGEVDERQLGAHPARREQPRSDHSPMRAVFWDVWRVKAS